MGQRTIGITLAVALSVSAPFEMRPSAIDAEEARPHAEPEGPRATPSHPGMPTLTGAEAWAAIVGNSIVGGTPDGPYTEFFTKDGTVRHLDRDGTSTGRWRLEDGHVCLLFPEDDEEECRTAELGGAGGAFLDRDGSRYPFALMPGNAKNL